MNELIIKENNLTVNNNILRIVEYKGEKVISSYDIARLHNKEVKRVNEQFKRNIDKFVENRDYFIINREEIMQSHFATGISKFSNHKVEYLFTERGYLKLTKTFNDDLSWKIQRILIKSYFKIKELAENNFKVPKTFKEALLLAVEQQEEIERLELENKQKEQS